MIHTDTELLLSVGRYFPDVAAPEGRGDRMESYLAALSRELEELYIRTNRLLRELDERVSGLEQTTDADADAGREGGDAS